LDKDRRRVSIAMAVCNGENYIAEQLQSVLSQTRPPDEVIICDDGSSDGTVSLVNDFIVTHGLSGWHVSVNPQNLGYVRNFYNAIGQTTGDIIFLCDQDDVWHPDKIEKMVRILEQNPHIQVLNSGFQKIDGNGRPIAALCRRGRSNNNLITRKLKQSEIAPFDFEYIIWRNISPGCTLCFTDEAKTFFLKNHTGLCPHDWEMNIFGAVLGGLYFFNEALTAYRIHQNNTIGLADLKTADRFFGMPADKRIESAKEEFQRADAYSNAGWTGLLSDKRKKALDRYRKVTHDRFLAIEARRFGLWLRLFCHPRCYLKLRGPQGMLNDLAAVLRKGART